MVSKILYTQVSFRFFHTVNIIFTKFLVLGYAKKRKFNLTDYKEKSILVLCKTFIILLIEKIAKYSSLRDRL